MKNDDYRLASEQCRWRCDPDTLGFDTTEEITPSNHILGQENAVEALRFGLKNRFKGDNVFVRGVSGFGRMALINEAIAEITDEDSANLTDRCYVYNFETPDRPRLLNLPAGNGSAFKHAMDQFAEFVVSEIPEYLASDIVKSRQRQILAEMEAEVKALGAPFEQELHAAGLALVPVQVGNNTMPVILPVIDGTPRNYEELQQLRIKGTLSDEDFEALTQKVTAFQQQMGTINEQVAQIQLNNQDKLQKFIAGEARSFAETRVRAIKTRFEIDAVHRYLDEVITDLVENRFTSPDGLSAIHNHYRVNLVAMHNAQDAAPVVSVTNPTLANLIGRIDSMQVQNGLAMSDHTMIKPGALLEADGGFLIIEAREILAEPGAWAILMRTLKSGKLDISGQDLQGPWPAPRLKPEPAPIDVKVILVGEPETYYMLDQFDTRFTQLFKVLADFTNTIERNSDGYHTYANVIARLARRDNLLPFTASSVAQLIEHGARICAQKGRLTSRFGRIADLAREASFIAQQEGNARVEREQVRSAIAKSKRRADLPARNFRRMIAEGNIRISVSGQETGQINGLAVTSAGPLVYGFPSRITASLGPGSAGMINIERESDLSGSVHTKGFLIINGLLRHFLPINHPLSFSAFIAFEQSYGGIDGDSASGAEFCCLLSALSGHPIRQDLAMTGAVDQKGNILPIGAVSEKVEGFFDACQSIGFNGQQGVIIPRANEGELMLREDVVDAINDNTFNVYSIDRIEQALELFMETPTGDRTAPTEGTLLHAAQQKVQTFWETCQQQPVARP